AGNPRGRTGIPPPGPENSSPQGSDGPKRRTRRMVVLAAVLVAVAAAVFFTAKFWPTGLPQVVLMDTTAPGGVYDEDNVRLGMTNASELTKVLRGLKVHTVEETLPFNWDREVDISN